MRREWIAVLALASCNRGAPAVDQGVPTDASSIADAAPIVDATATVDLTVVVVDASVAPDLTAVPDLTVVGDLATVGGPNGNQLPTADIACGASTCKTPTSACCRASPSGSGTCVVPGGACAQQKYFCDNGDDCPPAFICCSLPNQGSACLAPGDCQTQQGRQMCLTSNDCAPGERCCGVGATPNWYCSNNICPISRRSYKRDIRYLDERTIRKLHDDLVRAPVVAPHGRDDTIDLYAYTSMAVAALQEQARQIDALRRQLRTLRRQLQRH